MSHDSGFRRRSHDISSVHKQRKRRDRASNAFEERIRQQQEAKERKLQSESAVADEEDVQD